MTNTFPRAKGKRNNHKCRRDACGKLDVGWLLKIESRFVKNPFYPKL